ncbi:hypothetical protein P692DRAFT_20817391 [Suillus brevipes Sb2]|nr:hypothetical protein P692DRAFT_20817391 [Suillus brevipes Sb2]
MKSQCMLLMSCGCPLLQWETLVAQKPEPVKLTHYVTTTDHEINKSFPDLVRSPFWFIIENSWKFTARRYYRKKKSTAGISMNGGNCIRGNRMHTRAKVERGIKVGGMMGCGTTNEEQQTSDKKRVK